MSDDCIIAKNRYGSYCVPRSSRRRPASRAILGSDVWEPGTLDLLRAVDPQGDIVHAGAFFGDFIPALARSRQAGARVWAFEPSSENHRCAEATVALNELDNVVLTRAALDEAAGTALLATYDEEGVPLGGGSHILRGRGDHERRRSEEVRLMAVDEVVGWDRRVAAIQLDVEDREHHALSGAMDTIARCRPLLVLEKSYGSVDWIADNLGPLGYERKGSVHGNAVLACPE